MNPNILNTEVQAYINAHLKTDVSPLLLKGSPFDTVDIKTIVEQIEAKVRSKKKLPTWFNAENIYYPNKLNIEQTSSEITALYKSELISGETIIDLTGGLGVDCFYFSKKFKSVTHCEINQDLSNIVKHNYEQLNVKNATALAVDGIVYLQQTNAKFDWIYIDPSRRHDSKGKVFFLADCLPNVPEYLNLLFKRADNILIKTSPLLDISVGINELKYVKSIHIIAVNNEVKELLWVLGRGFLGEISIETQNIKPENTESFSFLLNDEKQASPNYHLPLEYLYEPNSAILKSGGFNTIAKNYNIAKLHVNSHLYTSAHLIDFPGRRFKVETIIPYNKKALKQYNISKANITTRNFPETVAQIRKKFDISDGGNTYLFFTTDFNGNKIVVKARKV
ncbi:MAG: THUMP-like domain-containing protein [Flavobacteriaceae bacterium]